MIKDMPLKHIKYATLLSEKEAEELLTKEERTINRHWWLRTPGCYPKSLCTVNGEGKIYYRICSYVDYTNGVRPALVIDSGLLDVGDYFIFGNYRFKVISDCLALCGDIIGLCNFREDLNAEDTNEYDKSDIKKYIDNWFCSIKSEKEK